MRKPFKNEPKLLFPPTSSASTTTAMSSLIACCQLAPCPLVYEVRKKIASNAAVPAYAAGQKRGNRLTIPRGDKLSDGTDAMDRRSREEGGDTRERKRGSGRH